MFKDKIYVLRNEQCYRLTKGQLSFILVFQSFNFRHVELPFRSLMIAVVLNENLNLV